jgi:prepilin-type N-terminal cleavage/methylation domain-containing protein
MLGFAKTKNRGDTLIEVLFAVAIFSLVAVGGIMIMNQGTATAQRSLEITLSRNEMDAQVETLRFLNASYASSYQAGADSCAAGSPVLTGPAGEWQKIHCNVYAVGASSASAFGGTASCPSSRPAGSFVLNTKSATYIPATSGKLSMASTYAQATYTGNTLDMSEGVWIEGIRPNPALLDSYQSNTTYIDFHVRACWDSPGQSFPLTLGTIVRLYEPRG